MIALTASLAALLTSPARAQDAGASTPPPQGAPPAQLRALSPDGTPLGDCPLEHTDVEIEVSGFVLRARVRHRFVNPFPERIEAVYAFPLPESAAVDEMQMRIGDRVVSAEIQRREDARRTYEDARSEGRTASLLEEERPNIFTASVANIRPGVPIEVSLRYVEVLRPDAGTWELAFPMTIGPRFIPGEPVGTQSGAGWAPDTDRVADASRITPPVAPTGRSGHDISLAVTLDAGAPIDELAAVAHDVTVSRLSPERARIQLAAHDSIFNRDFVLRWSVAPERVGARVLTHRTLGEGGAARDGYLTLMLQSRRSPPLDEITRREIVFVLDTSGSMYGQPMDLSKELMERLIDDLRPEDTFGVLRYDDSASALWPTPMAATPERRREALDFVRSLEGSGGTDALGGVRAAFAYPRDSSRLRIVVFLTDGYIGNDDEVIREVQSRIGEARLFSFGVGSSVNRHLLEEMARVGRGDGAIVTLRHDPHDEVRRFYERLRRPYLTDVSVDWGGLAVDQAQPERLPDLFAGQPVLLHARYAQPGRGTVTVRGRLGGRPFAQRVEVVLPEREEANGAIASVWARERIAELERTIRARGEAPALTDALTDVALSHRLVSRFTSFVAVESRVIAAADQTDPSRTVMVPVEMPEGVSADRVFESSLSLARLQPGDPELRVGAPPDARAVVAVFPFGDTHELRFEPRLGVWTTRFLVPRATPEGNYHIAILVTLADGSQERLSESYTVDGSAPEVELSFEGALVPGAEVRVLARQRFTDADRRLHGRLRVDIASDVARLRLTTDRGESIVLSMSEPGVWEGVYAVPDDASGEAALTLTAIDVAGNRGVRVVRVAIEEETR